MTAFLHSARLSEEPFMQRLQARFGLLGYARWMKALEMVAAGPRRAKPGIVRLLWADWLLALDCDDDTLGQLLDFAERAGKLRRHDDGETVEFVGFADLLPQEPEPAPYLFTTPDQLAGFCAIDLCFPSWLLEKPETRQLFARWCASNVTRDELEKAAELAAQQHSSLSPTVLHDQLQAVRRARIEAARA